MERRNKPRICEPFPAVIRGVDARGVPFEAKTVIDNLSASGLYVRLTRSLEPGTELAFTIQLSIVRRAKSGTPRVSANGVVVRAELSGNEYGVGVQFTQHRFL